MSDTLPTATRVSDPGIRALYRLENRWQAWLDVEVALARAQAELGIIPRRRRRSDRAGGPAGLAGPRAHRRRLRAHRPHDRAVGLGAQPRSSASRMAAGCTGAPRRRTSRRPAICWCCARRMAIFLRLIGEALAAMADLAERGADMPIAGAHAWPARGAGHVRLQGCGMDRRTAAPCRAAAPGSAAHFRRHAGRRCRHLRLARQARAAGAGRHRPAAWLRHDGGAVARARRSSGGEHLPARHARRDLRQDRPRDLYADEDRIRRGGGAGAARHRRQLHHAAEAQSEAVPGHHRRVSRGARDGAAGAGGDADRTRGRSHHQPDDGFGRSARLHRDRRHARPGLARSCAGCGSIRRGCGAIWTLAAG